MAYAPRMNRSPHVVVTIAALWAEYEGQSFGGTLDKKNSRDARNIFYSGAAAVMAAMVEPITEQPGMFAINPNLARLLYAELSQPDD